jgi:hypothetical protein
MKSNPSVLNVFYRRLLLPALTGASLFVLAYIVWLTLFVPNFSTDNVYNLGLIQRSAMGPFLPLLKTSFSHWYFKAYPPVRAEDWHRSVALVILALLRRISGTDCVPLLRIPHFLWVTAWFAALYRIFKEVQSYQGEEPLNKPWRLSSWFNVLLLAVIILVSSAGPEVLTSAFLDDVPAAVFALLGIGFLLHRRFGYTDAIMVGTCCGLAFWMKDLYLLWAPLGPLLIGIRAFFADSRPKVMRFAGLIGFCCAAMVLVYIPKLTWNYLETGLLIPNVASLGIQGRQIKTLPDGEHYFYFLFDKASIEQGSLFSADVSMLKERVWEGTTLTARGIKELRWTWAWLGFSGLAIALTGKYRRPAGCLFAFLAAIMTVYSCFFMLHLGEPLQLRYWLVPVSLASVLGVTGVNALPLSKFRDAGWFVSTALSVSILAIILMVTAQLPAIFKLDLLKLTLMGQTPFIYPPPVITVLRPYISTQTALMLQTNRGAIFWARYPAINIVGVKVSCLTELNHEQFEKLVDIYNISAAIFNSKYDEPAVYFLKQNGFVEIERLEEDIILVRRPPLPGVAMVKQLLAVLQAQGRGRDGTQALVDVIRQLGGR